MLHAYTQPTLFVDDVDMPLGESDLDILTNNAIILDALSFRSPEVISSSAGKDTSTPGYYVGTGNERIFWGAFQMQSGMTTLTIEGWAQKGASESFQLFLNGAGISTTAVPNGTTFTLTASVTGLAVGDIGEVVIQISGTGYGGSGVATKYVIYDAYVGPVTVTPLWVAPPTFAGTYNATKLNQLGDAQAYVAARLNAIPYYPFLAAYYTHGSSITGDTYPLWWGSVERANGSNILNVRIAPTFIQNVATAYRVTVNGSTVHTSSTYTVGQTDDDYLSIDLSSFTAGTRLETVIEEVITTGAAAGPSGDRNTRFHLWAVRMSNSAPAVAATPTEFTAAEVISSSTVDSRLNALSTMVSDAKARIDANPRIFNRVRLMRRMFGRDSGQYSVFTQANTYVQRFTRRGSRLIVSGKGVKVGWGAITTKAEKTVTTAYSVDFAHSETLTDGDAYQTKVIYLDTLPYLRRGQAYSIYGTDVKWAAEILV